MKKRQTTGFDLVSAEARRAVEGWAERSRGLFAELLEDAGSDLQRELLNRAVAAGHSASEVHAFADALRGLTDSEAFDRCTVERQSAPGYSVVQLLKAEADPLFAFKLQGGELSPKDEGPKLPDGLAYRARAKFDLTDPRIRMERQGRFDARDDGGLRKSAGHGTRELGKSPDADENTALKKNPLLAARELGQSSKAKVDGPARQPSGASTAAPAPAATGPSLAQDLLNEALSSLGVTFREQAVDGQSQPKLEDLMGQAAQALQRGLPVPVALGPAPGQDRRVALFLQVQQSGKSRAYQLFDVLSQEIAWINEGDLFARAELPFASKQNRRITRIALPVSRF